MSDREDRLRSLLDRVRAKRPEERETHAADAVERIRTASGTTAAVATPSSAPPPPEPKRTPTLSSYPTQAAPPGQFDPPTTPGVESPTRYSSQPPHVERPLSVEPRARSARPSPASTPVSTPISTPVSAPATPISTPASAPAPTVSGRPEPIRPQSVAPTGQPVVYSTDPPEFPRPKTFGDLLELTLSLRPR